MSDVAFPLSHRFDVARLGNKAQVVKIVPDTAELARMAEAYGLVELASLTADLEVRPWHKAGAFVIGTLSAKGAQRCVVTLEPVPMQVSDRFERAYEPAPTVGRRAPDLADDGEIEIDLEAPEPPDEIVDGIIDLGALVCEQFVLALDPFPRAPGAELAFKAPVEADDADDERPNPFAVLQKLKDQDPQ
ncbi:YceD family protein [Pannonibacter sp.]|uniref:YceD family protein n=1 Tax=Pannonibacter sp. TaxID=1906786 RepID=UPI003F730449